MAQSSLDDLNERAQQYHAAGLDWLHAFDLAIFEAKLEQWPTGWGDDFVALLYGDFDPPEHHLHIERLGITIEPEKITDTVIKTARTVVKARVAIPEKTVPAVKEAIRKLNVLVGVLSWTNQGAPIRWFTFLTSPTSGGVLYRLGEKDLDPLLTMIDLFMPEARRKITAALHWLREPRSMLIEFYRTDYLALYAGYWNAFELLVGVVNLIMPRQRPSRSEQSEAIRNYLSNRGDDIGPAEIKELFQTLVEPGLRPNAEHALRICAPGEADYFIKQCFDYKPKNRSLYDIRNAINHGTADVDDPETWMIIQARFSELHRLVFTMLVGVMRANTRSNTV